MGMLEPAAMRRGGGVIGLLIVVVIILCLTVFWGPLSKDQATQVTQAETYINRGQSVACQMNVNNMKTQITQMQLSSGGGVTISKKILEKKNLLLKCPDGGEYVFQDGQIYCSVHNPPPVAATPEPTPEAAAPATEAGATTPTAEMPLPQLGIGLMPTPAPQ